jgi:hypothetical protein
MAHPNPYHHGLDICKSKSMFQFNKNQTAKSILYMYKTVLQT